MPHSTAMPATFIKSWHEQKAKLKEKFPSLTDADLQFVKRRKDEMLKRVQIKLGKTKEELAAIISQL